MHEASQGIYLTEMALRYCNAFGYAVLPAQAGGYQVYSKDPPLREPTIKRRDSNFGPEGLRESPGGGKTTSRSGEIG